MALEKTWGYADNVVHGDVSTAHRTTAWYFWWKLRVLLGLEALVDQGGSPFATAGLQDWAIAQCSDSVTVNTAGGDLLSLTGTFDDSKWVVGTAAGFARSWALLYNARLGIWFLLDFQGSTNLNIHSRVLFTTPTTGTTTSPPTATVMIDGGVPSTSSAGLQLVEQTNVGVGRHVHARIATDGSFFFFMSRDTSGAVQTQMHFHKLTEAQSGDPYPWVFGWEYASGGCMRSTSSFLGTGSTTSSCYDNGSAQQAGPIQLVYPKSGAGYDRLMKVAVQRADTTYEGDYLYFFAVGSSRRKGRAQDWHLASDITGENWLSPNATAPLQVQIGGCLVPGRGLLSL